MTTTGMRTKVGRLEGNIGFLAARFSYIAAKLSNRTLAPFDLTVRPYSLLELASTDEGMSQRELGRLLHLDPSHVLRLVDRLAERGLVERARDASDRRVTVIRATADGRRMAAEAAEALELVHAELLADLPSVDRAELTRLLQELGLSESI